ncbi:hypothetical protein Q7C_1416 [Methylophaga frappieri]|uniref:Transporter n=1 Tax=Methylophaga frappieri (strain ATCC BAA-2434 / DSM 25690 / JAM7) TaxID=754477 RepID=I1YI23_METFJ|nr:DUF502 domain-containing protein [Methylophaga frappieri]AFJ02566.1 hypothetical protein Q7C_1416 [Methylophaga frappieri]
MQFIWKTFLKGLAALLPVGLTLYIIYWLALSAEKAVSPILKAILPEHLYWPGMGLLAGIGLIFAVGIAVNAWLIKRLFDLGESLLERIPLVKSIHGALRDFMHFFSRDKQRENLNHAVAVTINGVHLIGFQVRDNIHGLLENEEDTEDRVAVYLPMSYQIGGYTVLIPRNQVQALELGTEDAMRWILTAGLSTSDKHLERSPIIQTPD